MGEGQGEPKAPGVIGLHHAVQMIHEELPLGYRECPRQLDVVGSFLLHDECLADRIPGIERAILNKDQPFKKASKNGDGMLQPGA